MGETGQRVWLSRYFDEHTRRLDRTIVDAELPEPMQSDTNYSYDPAGNITSVVDAPREQQADVQCFEVRRYDPAPPLDAGHLVLADPEGNEFCLD